MPLFIFKLDLQVLTFLARRLALVGCSNRRPFVNTNVCSQTTGFPLSVSLG